MRRILITDPVSDSLLSSLSHYEVIYIPNMEREELKERIKDADVVIVRSRTKLDKKILIHANKLKLIVRAGVGLDNIDCEFAKSKGIKVRNTKGVNAQSVAELTMGFILSLSRRIVPLSNSTKSGRWEKGKGLGFEIRGKNLGIVGTGEIGRRVAILAKAFQMNVSGFDPKNRVDFIKYLSFNEILSLSHFITIHVPLTKETYHLIDIEAVKRMRRGIFLINTSRGGVVDEEALIFGLENGIILGCALDVFEIEPPKKSRLFEFENCILTPHIGGNTKEAKERIKDEILRILREFELTPSL